jgi:4'-phosphopantetheinyl transferase
MSADYDLADGQVHIWLLELKAPIDPTLRTHYVSLLDAQERARLGSFAFQHLRDEYLVSHALTRLILSRYEGMPASGLTMVRNAYGRPELNASRIGLRFNLSHAAGLAALAVTQTADIGVDLEREDRQLETAEIARHYFAPAETEWLRRQPQDRQKRSFLEQWTLKEAYVKARGLGLSLELNRFAIDLDDRETPTILFPDGFDDPADWQLSVFQPIENYVLSLAVRRPAARGGQITWVDAAKALNGLQTRA